MTQPFSPNLEFAQRMDQQDALARFRAEFLFPKRPDGQPSLYFAGNSLGLQPRKARDYISEELEDWEKFGVEGHLHARHPWLPYHEFVTEPSARLVGATPREVVVMNTLSVNLHLLMVSFYRPTAARSRILIEAGAFPSDRYAVASQARFHGYDPAQAILEIAPRAGEDTIRDEDLLALIEREGSSIALILLGNANYLTGQSFPMAEIVRAGHAKGCKVGFDLAHGAGSLLLRLHDWDVDFAAWCSYKYLNSGPGALAGAFIHERHLRNPGIPRFEGWWGHNKSTRFKMPARFDAMDTAEAWQLSNPPIFQLAAMRASLELFDAATMPALRAKSERLMAYLEFLVDQLPPGFCTQVTPRDSTARGGHLSLRIHRDPPGLVARLAKEGVIADFREPDICRFAPCPLYTRFVDVHELVQVLSQHGKR